MDKAEYRIKLEQINSLAEAGDFKGAAAVVDTIDWRHVKSVRTLCMVGEIYEANKRYEDSKRILQYAYKRSSISKTVLYRLAEINIRLGDYDEAKRYYNEFEQLSPHDTSRYILKYKLLRAEGATLDDQIAVLREYKEREYTERWAYELAKLYMRNGQTQKCVEECDEMILWFAEGKYVTRAMELKMQVRASSDPQKKKYSMENADEAESIKEEVRESPAAPEMPATKAAESTVNEEELYEEVEEKKKISSLDAIRKMEAAADETVSSALSGSRPNVMPGTRQSRDFYRVRTRSLANEYAQAAAQAAAQSAGKPAEQKVTEESIAASAAAVKEIEAAAEAAVQSIEEKVEAAYDDIGGTQKETVVTKSAEDVFESAEKTVEDIVEETIEAVGADDETEEVTVTAVEEVVESTDEAADAPVEEAVETVTKAEAAEVENAAAEEFIEAVEVAEKAEAAEATNAAAEEFIEAVEEAEEVIEAEKEVEKAVEVEEAADEIVAEEYDAAEKAVEDEAVDEEADEIVAEETAEVAKAVEEIVAEEEDAAAEAAAEAEQADQEAEEIVAEETAEVAKAIEEFIAEETGKTVEVSETVSEIAEEAEVAEPAGAAEPAEAAEEAEAAEAAEIAETAEVAEPAVLVETAEAAEEAAIEMMEKTEESEIVEEESDAESEDNKEEESESEDEEDSETEAEDDEEEEPESESEDDEEEESEEESSGPTPEDIARSADEEAEKALQEMMASFLNEFAVAGSEYKMTGEVLPDDEYDYDEDFSEKESADDKERMLGKETDESLGLTRTESFQEQLKKALEEGGNYEEASQIIISQDEFMSPEEAAKRTVMSANGLEYDPDAESDEDVEETDGENAEDADSEGADGSEGAEASDEAGESGEEEFDDESDYESEEVLNELVADEEELEKGDTSSLTDIVSDGESENVEEDSEIVEQIMAEPEIFELVEVLPRPFTEEERALFTYFADIPGISEQVTLALADIHNNSGDKTSRSGNVLVMGRQVSGKTRLAEALVRAVCIDLNIKAVKLAKVIGEDLNGKDPVEIVDRMSGGFLIIEGAGSLNEEFVEGLNKAMEFRTDDLVVILEDERGDLMDMLEKHPEFAEKFTSTIIVPVFTNDELVTFARTYAKEMGYKLDEMGTLALYTMIGENQKESEPVVIGKVKKMIDQAIERSKGSRFTALFRKAQVAEDGRIWLREKDFTG